MEDKTMIDDKERDEKEWECRVSMGKMGKSTS